MEAIIRTQDRKLLILCKNGFEIALNERKYNLESLDNNDVVINLGQFNKKETAIKELDRIHDAIKYYMMYEKGKIPFVEINEDYDVE